MELFELRKRHELGLFATSRDNPDMWDSLAESRLSSFVPTRKMLKAFYVRE